MKINIIKDPQRVINGYHNVCKQSKLTDNPLGVEYLYTQLAPPYEAPDWISDNVDNGEAEEIFLYNTLEDHEFDDVPKIVTMLATKLRHGGQLKLIVADILALSRGILKQELSLAEFNEKLAGAALTLPHCLALLRASGLVIKTQSLDGYDFHIVAERP